MIIGRFRVKGRKDGTWFYGAVDTVPGTVTLIASPFDGSIQADTEVRYNLSDLEKGVSCVPTKVVAVGLNYKDHAAELGMALPEEPLIFLKPPSSLLAHGGVIRYPLQSARVDYEAELAIVIKKRAAHVSCDTADECILGYTNANDVTARDLQKKDGQWARAKSFDTFCPLGPYIYTDIDPAALSVITRVNGIVRQASNTEEFIFSVDDIVCHVSSVMTLYPGDVILTGTPAGIGPLQRGDEVSVQVGTMEALINTIA